MQLIMRWFTIYAYLRPLVCTQCGDQRREACLQAAVPPTVLSYTIRGRAAPKQLAEAPPLSAAFRTHFYVQAVSLRQHALKLLVMHTSSERQTPINLVIQLLLNGAKYKHKSGACLCSWHIIHCLATVGVSEGRL